MLATLEESTPPLSGKKNPPCPERLKQKQNIKVTYEKHTEYNSYIYECYLDSASNRNEYQENFLWVNEARA